MQRQIDHSMTANNITPFEPTHPGEFIREELESRGITQKSLAARMNVSYTVLNEIINCKRPISPKYALLLEATLGIDAYIWLNAQARYNLMTAKKDKSLLKKIKKITSFAAAL